MCSTGKREKLMSKISVIIPCYNAEKYIKKCFDGLEKQIFKEFDVIVIDDFSTDNSLNILYKIKQKSKLKIKVIEMKQNVGPGEARNVGIKASDSEYLAFCDSDDYYEENFLYCLYNKAVEQSADVVMCNSKLKLQNGSFRNNSYTNIFKLYNTKSDYIALSRTSLCYLLLRRNLFEDLPIPSLRNGEDMAIIPLLLAKARIITHIDNALYVYCVRKESASVSVSANSFWDLLKCQQIIEKSWNKEYQEALQFIGIKNVLYSAVLIGIKAKVNTKVIKDTIRKFEREHNKWYLNSYIKTLDFRHRFFLKTIKYRCLVLTKAYVFLHSLLMK